MKYACQYAIVRFLPYVETGEFANVGIVLTCPQTGYLGFKLLRRSGRIVAFFDELDKNIFKNVRNSFDVELKRIREVLAVAEADGAGQQHALALTKHLFAELVRPRESIIRFSELRAVLADDPGKKIEELFDCYVERNFATKQYQEKLLEQHVHHVLRQANLAKIYGRHDLSCPAYHVNFPFVKMVNGKATRIIKPLHLDREDPTQIYNHGMEWVIKLDKLRTENLLPEAVLFAIDAPDKNKNEQFDAFTQVKAKLEKEVVVINYGEEEKLLEFATDAMV